MTTKYWFCMMSLIFIEGVKSLVLTAEFDIIINTSYLIKEASVTSLDAASYVYIPMQEEHETSSYASIFSSDPETTSVLSLIENFTIWNESSFAETTSPFHVETSRFVRTTTSSSWQSLVMTTAKGTLYVVNISLKEGNWYRV